MSRRMLFARKVLSITVALTLVALTVRMADAGCCVSWSRRAGEGPGPRYGHALAYDGGSGRVTLFGGFQTSGNAGRKNDTWVWNSTQRAWTNVTPAGDKPSPRLGHAMAGDPDASRIILFGGFESGIYTNDTWEWDGVAKTWGNVTPGGLSPSRRTGHVMAFDPVRGTVLLFGGVDIKNAYLNDTWEWNVAQRTWVNVTPAGLRPAPRGRAGMAYDAANNKFVLFGGLTGTLFLDDTWEWDAVTKTWANVTPAATKPSARSSPPMVFHSVCEKVVLYGGETTGNGLSNETWEWDGLTKSWRLTAEDASGPGARTQHATAYDPNANRVVLFGGSTNNNVMAGDTWELACPCADEAASEPVTLPSGEVVFPFGPDANEIAESEEVVYDEGFVKDLYPEHDTSVDTWYTDAECEMSIGGTEPPEESEADLVRELAEAGVTGVTPQEIADLHVEWERQIEVVASQEQMKLSGAGPVAPPYTPPAAPHCRRRGCKYVFGGRDLVFVHGLRLSNLMDKITGKPEASAEWKEPTVFPGSIENPEFYGSGYFKRGAEQYWKAHLDRFMRSKGIQNRYLIVAYSSNERLETAAHAVLTQIGDAMRTGEGVVDPSGKKDHANFGAPSFVVVSHSTGAPVTDVAMASAVKHPNLRAGFIARHAKAHIALAGAFSGSRMATAAVALSGYAAVKTPDWVCPVARLGLMAWRMGDAELPKCPIVFNTVTDSILIDLVPVVMQLKWGGYIGATPVRTLTVVGAHPTFYTPLKRILHPGFDDGVLTINSQVANPNSAFLWPSGFRPRLPRGIRTYDMGVAALFKGLASPFRAGGYYRDQVFEPRLNPAVSVPHPLLVAAGATANLSPTGMVQPVAHEYDLTGGYSPLRRYPNHYSAFQSASDHYSAYTGPWDSLDDKYYHKTFLSERNLEETRVITDPAVYDSYEAAYPCDNQPLLNRATVPQPKQVVRSRPLGKKKKRWVWKRTYRLLEGWENKVVMDYVYESVLAEGCTQCAAPAPEDDCNQNGFENSCDISSGRSQDCNRNGAPDECEGVGPVNIRGIQPSSISSTAGQSVTFIATARTAGNCGPLTYRWSKGGVELKDGGAFSGTQTDKLTINPISKADAGQYVVTVTNACGCSSTTFSTLTVIGEVRVGVPGWSDSPGVSTGNFGLKRGMNIFGVWGGVSPTSPTLIGSVEDARLALFALRYGRVLAANERFALEYTFDAIPLTVLSYPDFNVSPVGTETSLFRVEKVRRTVYGAGLSPLGFQFYFRPQNRVRPFVSASGGFLYFKDPVPKFSSTRFNPNFDFGGTQFLSRAPRLNDIGFNLTVNFGGGIQVSTRPWQAFTIGYKYHHFSNAYRAPNNPGFDGHVFYTGYSFFLR